MSLSSKTELARALFRSTPPDSVTRISGTATADSSDGTVTVQLEDGDVIEVGTIGSVSSGDTVTIHVQRGEAQVIASEGWGDAMQAAVDEAQAIAEATGQHFWHDSNGAHVTEVTADQWAQSQTGHNILVNSLGILLRKALNYIAAWTGSALSFYDGDGNAASNVTASFGSAGAQIGKVDESHIEMDYHSMRLIDKEGHEFFEVEDLRDSSGLGRVVDTWTGDGVVNRFNLSYEAGSLDYSVSVSDSSGGTVTKHSDEIVFSTAPSNGAIITADYTSASYMLKAYTLGMRDANSVSGGLSVAEGYSTTASGEMSHAEGRMTVASGRASHAEGIVTSATGRYAHAEGGGTEASGLCSHASGTSTIAQGSNQTAIGSYNVADITSALIIGNGTGINTRSNALTVDWNGNVEAAGTIEAKCGVVATSGVATASTGTAISAQEAVKWGGIAQVRLAFTRNSAITVLASGNITDFTAVTLASEYRPKVATAFACPADDAGPIFGTINTDGTVVVKYAEATGAQRTIASGTAFHVSATLVTG